MYESSSGFYYLQTRFYDSETGRFINADDVGYLGASGDFASYNLFAYCSNNPVMFVDPTGHFIITITLGGALLSAILTAVVDAIIITTAVAAVGLATAMTVDAVQSYKKEKAEEKAKEAEYIGQYDDRSLRKHHIVAQAAKRAKPAQDVLEKYEINRISDPHNIVVIPHGFHKSMHTKKYYDYVNSKIEACTSKEEVYDALDQLSIEIQRAASGGLVPWA